MCINDCVVKQETSESKKNENQKQNVNKTTSRQNVQVHALQQLQQQI